MHQSVQHAAQPVRTAIAALVRYRYRRQRSGSLAILRKQEPYWNGANGLQAILWAKTEAMRRNICYLDAEPTLSEADLAAFDFKKKVYINGMDYLPLRISNCFPLRAATKALLVQV